MIGSKAAETSCSTSTSTSWRGVDRQFLVERQLISREHAEGQGARGRGHRPRTSKFSLMINEEDHLRIQVMQSGLDLAERLGADQPHRRR